jgi:hypothetical protein
MLEGVVWNSDQPGYTMTNGKWTDQVDGDIVVKYPKVDVEEGTTRGTVNRYDVPIRALMGRQFENWVEEKIVWRIPDDEDGIHVEWVWAREAGFSMPMKHFIEPLADECSTEEPIPEDAHVVYTMDDVIGIAADMHQGVLYFSSQNADKGKGELMPNGERSDRWHEVFRLLSNFIGGAMPALFPALSCRWRPEYFHIEYKDETAADDDIKFVNKAGAGIKRFVVQRVAPRGIAWRKGIRKGHDLCHVETKSSKGLPNGFRDLPADKLFTRSRFHVFYKNKDEFDKDVLLQNDKKEWVIQKVTGPEANSSGKPSTLKQGWLLKRFVLWPEGTTEAPEFVPCDGEWRTIEEKPRSTRMNLNVKADDVAAATAEVAEQTPDATPSPVAAADAGAEEPDATEGGPSKSKAAAKDDQKQNAQPAAPVRPLPKDIKFPCTLEFCIKEEVQRAVRAR